MASKLSMPGELSIMNCHSGILGFILAMLGSLVIAGCKKPAEITRYQVPKEKGVVAAPAKKADVAEGKKAGQDRMLAAIVPHGEQAWFFKIAGEGEAVGKLADEFESIMKSVAFPEAAGGQPEWKLPEGWKQLPGSQFRFATLVAPAEDGAKPLELTVTTLPWKEAEDDAMTLSNVNRWRGQVSLTDLSADELEKNVRRESLPAGKAVLVDLKGTLKDGGMRPPFARPSGTEK